MKDEALRRIGAGLRQVDGAMEKLTPQERLTVLTTMLLQEIIRAPREKWETLEKVAAVALRVGMEGARVGYPVREPKGIGTSGGGPGSSRSSTIRG